MKAAEIIRQIRKERLAAEKEKEQALIQKAELEKEAYLNEVKEKIVSVFGHQFSEFGLEVEYADYQFFKQQGLRFHGHLFFITAKSSKKKKMRFLMSIKGKIMYQVSFCGMSEFSLEPRETLLREFLEWIA